MKRFMISAMQSASGKTVVTALLALSYRKMGMDVRVFKCGPDYIDPLLHNAVLSDERPGGLNIDLFLQGKQKALENFKRLSEGADLAVLEGVMGYYDGMGGSFLNSSYEIAALTDTPVILVIRPSGIGNTLCALLSGMLSYRADSHIAGVILNDCKPSLYEYLKPMIEENTGLKTLGYLPGLEEASIDSRHLGLSVALKTDRQGLWERFSSLSESISDTIDLRGILEIG